MNSQLYYLWRYLDNAFKRSIAFILAPKIFNDQVVKDVLGDDLWEEFFPDTDSDLEESSCSPYQLRKLWAYPRLS